MNSISFIYRVFVFSIIAFIILGASFIGCSGNSKEKGSKEYIEEINNWHKKREANLKKETGWLNLVGLFWLKEGENKFGSAKDNHIVFPGSNIPDFIGSFYLKDSIVTVKITPGVKVYNDSVLVTETIMNNDLSPNTTILKLGSLRWFVIKRGNKYGIRLRDVDAPLVKNFKGIEHYPVNEDWKITADFLPFDKIKKISIPTILNTVEEDYSPGYLSFNINSNNYKLLAIDEGEEFFIIFADETNGEETYGAGRFLYTAKPDSNNKVIIDFNKAYNPPCVFTKFATCPLPPKENYLHLKITAGEKKYGKGH